MAVSFVKAIATNSGKAITSLTATIPTGGVAQNDVLVLWGAANGGPDFSSITDPRSNTWTKLLETGLVGGSNGFIWRAQATTAYVAGDVITCNCSTSGAFALDVLQFTGLTTTSDGTGSAFTGNGLSASTVTPTVATDLAVGVADAPINAADQNALSGWVKQTDVFTTGGSAASNIDLAAYYQIETTTATVSFKPTSTAGSANGNYQVGLLQATALPPVLPPGVAAHRLPKAQRPHRPYRGRF